MGKTREVRQAVRVYLAEHDKTQRWLADKLGVHESFLSDVLSGRRAMSKEFADRMLKVTGVDLHDHVGAA